MKLIVTGSRELEYAEEFATEGQHIAAKALASREQALGRPLTKDEMGAALQLGRQHSLNVLRRTIWERLDKTAEWYKNAGDPITLLVYGGAVGVDRICASWAVQRGIDTKVYKPRWMKDGVLDRQAGFKRNWWMLFSEAGPQVSKSFERETGVVARQTARIDRLVEKAKESKLLHHLPYLIGLREPLRDPWHPERRYTLKRIGATLPENILVIAFHDGQSRGTAHCIMAAQTLGFPVTVCTWERADLPEHNIDRARIDHRPERGGAVWFSSFAESE